ncbi:MAG: hypothetical protein M1484_02075 [Patescibacteria group bacterium]|nr:hypothetical protein [Patescibacteria group bacterium]MCL5431868.1 hypothetical protein [Patescibacteria group bacterium]
MPSRNNYFLLPLVVALGLVSVAVVVFLVIRGVSTPQNAVPSHATSANTNSDPNLCQGNPNASAKCYKCETGSNKTNPIGILDFNCFNSWYGKTVGTP